MSEEQDAPGDMPLPREVKNVIQPVRLSSRDNIQFRCHPGVSCFNACCSRIEILLTPYDIWRLKRRFEMTSEEFLHRFTVPQYVEKGQFWMPVVAMDPESGQCPFGTPEGCSVYEDRPANCRYYPLGMAFLHPQEGEGNETFYFLIKEEFCKGHEERCVQSVAQWRDLEGVEEYDLVNRGWMELILKRRSMGDMATSPPMIMEMFYMASTNPEAFRRFVFESSLLQRYAVAEAVKRAIAEDDLLLFQFAWDWLKTVLFNDRIIPLRQEREGNAP